MGRNLDGIAVQDLFGPIGFRWTKSKLLQLASYGLGFPFSGKIHGFWLYNVSGFDAVELRLKSGDVYRLGTDDPEGLSAALKRR